MSIDVLLIGLGQIGMSYDLHLNPSTHIYSHARAFTQHSKFKLIGGVDTDRQKQQTFSQTYDCPTYDDIESALEKGSPTLVVVATPTPLHKQVLENILEHSSPQMILCEKPLSYNLQEAQKMVQNCENKKVKLYVNYIRRSDPGAIEIKRRIESNEFGASIKGVVWYSKGLIHNGSHFLNLLEYWLGSVKNFTVINAGRLWDNIDPEPDFEVNFERGDMIFFAAREEFFSHYTIEILSSNGRLRYEQGGEIIQWQRVQTDPNFKNYKILSDKIERIQSEMYRYQWNVAEQLAKAFDNEDSQLCSGNEALSTLKIIHQIIQKEDGCHQKT